MVGTWSSRGGEARNASPELEHFLESQWESRVSDSPALAPPRPSPRPGAARRLGRGSAQPSSFRKCAGTGGWGRGRRVGWAGRRGCGFQGSNLESLQLGPSRERAAAGAAVSARCLSHSRTTGVCGGGDAGRIGKWALPGCSLQERDPNGEARAPVVHCQEASRLLLALSDNPSCSLQTSRSLP